ncbi:unnamed protein product [Boreogadus saida]
MESGSVPTLLGSATNLGQQTPDTISIKVEEDIGGGMPAVEYCEAFGDRSTQRGAISESLGVDVPGSSHMSSHSGELKILSVYGKGEGPLAVDGHDTFFTASEVEGLVCHEELSVQQTPDTITIKIEEDIGGGMPAVEDCNDIRDCSMQRGDTSESLRVDAPGFSHMASHNGELRILSVYVKGEGPLAVDGHDTLFTKSEPEALSSLSADCSLAKSLNCSVRLVRLEELTGYQGGRKGRPGVLCGKGASLGGGAEVLDTRPDASTQTITSLHIGSFTDDCFLNLVQYKAGLAERRLGMESGSVPTLLGSATNLGRATPSIGNIQVFLSRDVACHTDHLETRTVATRLSLKTFRPHFTSKDHFALVFVQCPPPGLRLSFESRGEEDCDAFGDRSTQRGYGAATAHPGTRRCLGEDGPGSSHMSSHSGELRILSVYGKGEGPLAVDGHDTLFTVSEVEALNSLSADPLCCTQARQ